MRATRENTAMESTRGSCRRTLGKANSRAVRPRATSTGSRPSLKVLMGPVRAASRRKRMPSRAPKWPGSTKRFTKARLRAQKATKAGMVLALAGNQSQSTKTTKKVSER